VGPGDREPPGKISAERAAGACRNGSYTYKAIKTIFRKALALDDAAGVDPIQGRLENPGPARTPAALRQ